MNLFSTSHRSSGIRCAAALGAVFAASAIALACGGETDGGSGQQGVTAGGECAPEGDQRPADDGCNTCTCIEGSWACTEEGCGSGGGEGSGGSGTGGGVTPPGPTTNPPPGGCTPGDRRDSPDGCGFCSCTDSGEWACTGEECPPVACLEGNMMLDGCNACLCTNGAWDCTRLADCVDCPPPRMTDQVCPAVVVVARDPASGQCCEYGDPCQAPEGWAQFNTNDECVLNGAACFDGEMMMMGDGCNTCTCMNGMWGCTTAACPGQRGCGGWLGNTCTASEYCAYEEGQHCGAADASAVCLPRPMGCDAVYDPVCGCNGQTYGNACEAAMAGTGVLQSGPCVSAAD